MSQVSTNEVSIGYVIETALGTPPASPTWKLLEPNSIGTYGADITTVSREPISKNRQRKKGTTTDLDSSVEFEADLTLDHFIDFAEAFVHAVFNGPVNFSDEDTDQCTAVTGSDSYTVDANGDLAEDTLIFAQGFTNDANNGLKEVATGATGTDIPVEETLVAEASPPSTCEISVAGFRSAIGDLDVASVSGGVVTITSTALDFTTLGLTVGQEVYFGGEAAINKFSNAENVGYGRLLTIAANQITFDKTDQTWVTEANTTQLVDIYFNRFLRNVAVDDVDYIERSFHFEATYPDLGGIGTDEYEYAKGNRANEMTFNLPLTDKATIGFGFIGTDTEPPTTTRLSGSTTIQPTKDVAFNTSADIARLRIQQTDYTDITSYFKSLTLTLNNNVSPEKVLALLGAAFMNTGNFFVDVESQILFTDSAVPTAIRNNETLTMDFIVKNDNGAIAFDFPSITLGGGDKELPVNETVLMNTTGMAFEDADLGTSIGISLFPFIPAS